MRQGFVFVITGVCIVLVLSVADYLREHPVQHSQHSAKFTNGQCFEHNGVRESWTVGPDGVVVFKGYLKYLVLNRLEAERTGGGTKIGTEEDIESFDHAQHQVLCPVAWQRHLHGE